MKKILLLISVALFGCHKIHEGYVVKKVHERSEFYSQFICMPNGKTTTCQTYWFYDDEDFILIVKGVSGNDTFMEKFYVEESYFKCAEPGDYFNDTTPCDRRDKDVKTRKE